MTSKLILALLFAGLPLHAAAVPEMDAMDALPNYSFLAGLLTMIACFAISAFIPAARRGDIDTPT